MNYLLDTHTFIWWVNESSKLSDKVYKIIQNNENQILISVASL